jgi:para-aminobenzoate synthetase component 1
VGRARTERRSGGSPWRVEVAVAGSVPEVPALLAALAEEPGAFLLESSWRPHRFSRWSFLGARPRKVLCARGREVCVNEGARRRRFTANPFSALRATLAEETGPVSGDEARALGIPFLGGAVGFLGYDLCHFVERLPRTTRADIPLPDLYFAFYDALLTLDHREGVLYLVVSDREPGVGQSVRLRDGFRWLKDVVGRAEKLRPDRPATSNISSPDVWTSNFTRAEYLHAVARAIDYIKAGDIFQVNLSQRFEGKLRASPAQLYLRLREVNPAPFAAYLAGEDWAVVGASPERFLQVQAGRVETCPIKGTRPRSPDAGTDAELRQQLLNSEKDGAELTMIVDLERNDLGRVCDYGSVQVREPRFLDVHPTVYHLVATVEGVLAAGRGLVDLLRATFPGGSITGAPKVRAMQIIDELEPTARNLYTGALGYVGCDGTTDLSIVIRTFLVAGDRFWFQVGGGIVADSTPEAEYQETLDKGRGLVAALSARAASAPGGWAS